MTRVAIVDDHAAMREGLEALMRAAGLEVAPGAATAAAAADAIAHGAPDVALVDVALPDGSGVDLTRALIAEHPGLCVVVYAGAPEPELLSRALAAGARGFAVKSGSARELIEAIEHVARGGSYVDPRIERALLTGRPAAPVAPLSPREREVLALMAEGDTAEAVGTQLGIGVETVRTHVRNVVRKLRARNRVHAIALAVASGEIALDDEI